MLPLTSPAWRASLRIARRDVLRAKGRSLLVVTMVGLPVAATVMLTSLLATADITAAEAIPATMGSAQAVVQPLGARTPVDQSPLGDNTMERGGRHGTDTRPWTAAEVQELTGGRVVAFRNGSTTRDDGRRLHYVPVREIDLRDPATAGMVDLVSGRVPADAGEVTVSPDLADSGVRVGDSLRLDKGAVTATVVGVARARFADDSPALQAFPGTVLADDDASPGFLVARHEPVGWSEVRRLNESGLVAISRAVVAHPPPESAVPAAVRATPDGMDSGERAVLAIAITSIVIEVVLLAGPAFAVGVSRQRRQLALVAATGGEARDVRRVVLAQGVVLGVGAAALGVVVGLVAASLGIGPLRGIGAEMGPRDVVAWQLLAAFLIGSVAAVAAAWAPARQASRQDVVAVLAGRRGIVRARRGWPVLGLVLLVAGSYGAVSLGSRAGGETAAAFGTVIVVLGAVALMPAILGLVGRVAGWLPLPLRLAARDASRQRGRTAPAVAAVMGAVAGITALALGSSSDFAQSRRDYEPRYAMGTTVVDAYGIPERGWAQLDDAAAKLFAGRRLLAYSAVDVPYDDQGRPMSKEPSTPVVLKPGCPAPEVGEPFEPTVGCDALNGYGRATTVASADAIASLGVKLTPERRRVLESGGVLVGDPRMIGPDGRVHLALATFDYEGDGSTTRTRTLPALEAVSLRSTSPREGELGPGSALFATPETATRLHLPLVRSGGVLERGPEPLSVDDEERLKDLVPSENADDAVYTERGFQETYTVQLIALGLAGLVTVLVGTLTATGLALADARPDLATLAAVGARPRTRRTMAAAQALLIGLLGALTGVLVGFVPGWAVSRPLTTGTGAGPIFDVPWLLLGGIGLAVPLLAALGALVLVRSPLPLTRRIG